MSNENTIDTLVINIKGDDSASRTLDRVLKKLEQIKKSAKGGHFGSFNKQLSSLKSKVDGMFKGVNNKSVSSPQLEKLKAQADQSVKRIEDLTNRIHEMNTSFSDKPTSFMQKLIDKENELEATARRVKSQITGTTPQPLADKYNSQYADLRGQIEQVSNKQLDLVDNGRAFLTVAQAQPQAFDKLNDQLHQEEDHLDELRKKFDDISEKAVPRLSDRVKAFGGQVKTAFSESVVGKFGNKLHQTISRIGKMALYRIMRTMMKQVTEAFKTGMDDMYQYSKGFNGEYARSMDQLASANLSYKNSIGAIMAPVMNLVVPWLDKVVDKLMDINNTAAMVIAGLTGKSTYSKAVRVTTEYAAAASKAEKNTGKVTEKVKELRKSLAGLDEITIIGELADPTSTSRSIKDSAGESTPDYSSMFIEAPVDMAKVREIKEKLDQILQVAKWIGLAIGAWELVKFLSSIGEALTGIGLLKSQMVGLTIAIVGFAIEWEAGSKIGYGNADIMDYVKFAIASALGVVGTAMLFGFTPAGWAIGVAAALTIGIASIYVGMKKRLGEVVEEAFYGAGGTITISDLAGQFERYMQAVQNSHKPTVDLGNEINNLVDNTISPTIEKIGGIANAITYDESTAKEKLPEIKAEFDKLYNNSTDVLNKTHELIVSSIAGGFGDTLRSLGFDVPQLMALINGTTVDVQKKMDELNEKFEELHSQREQGTITTEKYNSMMGLLLDEFAKINGIVDPVKASFDGVTESLKGIDWENKNARDLAFSKISESANNAKTAVEDSYKSLKESLEYYARNAETEEARVRYEEMIAGSKAYRDQQMKLIQDKTLELAEFVQNDMIEKMSDVEKNLKSEFNKKDTLGKTLVGGEIAYLSTGLREYQTKVIEPAEQEIGELLSNLGYKGKTYASEAADNILTGLYQNPETADIDRKISAYIQQKTMIVPDTIKKTMGDQENAVKRSSERIRNAVLNPLSNLTDAQKKRLSEVGTDITGTIFNSAEEEAEVNSPSKRSRRLMGYILSGMIESVKGNQYNVISSFDSMLNTLFDRLEGFTNRWRESINTLFDDMAYGLKNADFRADGSYSYNYLPKRTVPRFAQGGVVSEDGLFYANHNEIIGQFSNGKTAVANNEQIVEGITEGVASANDETNSLLRRLIGVGQQLLEKDSTINVSDITKAMDRKNRRDGKVTVPVSI